MLSLNVDISIIGYFIINIKKKFRTYLIATGVLYLCVMKYT